MKDERQEKPYANGVKTVVKKEGGASSSVKSNGVVKREADSHSQKNGHKDSQLAKKKEDSSSTSVKAVVKKSVTTVNKTVVKTEEKKKKVFTLPGQKHEPPEERDPLRIFYESLHEQIPESEMAEVWMMEHGLLEAVHAKKALERKQRRQQHEKNGTPMKSVPSSDFSSKPANKPSVSNGKSKKAVEQKGKRKREYSSDDDEFIAKPVRRKLKT